MVVDQKTKVVTLAVAVATPVAVVDAAVVLQVLSVVQVAHPARDGSRNGRSGTSTKQCKLPT